MIQATFTKRTAGNLTFAVPLWGVCPPVSKGQSVAQINGLRYEAQVLRLLEDRFPLAVSHLGFRYVSDGRSYTCWPDAIVFNERLKIINVVEVKWRHTVDAWVHFKELYLPVIKKAFPSCSVHAIEVCKAYDPNVRLPGQPKIMTDLKQLEDVLLGKMPSAYSVLIWTGR